MIYNLIQRLMLRPYLILTLPLSLLLLACTAHEKQVIKELEDMPGITCTTSTQDVTHCGSDNLAVTADPQ